MLSTVMNQWKYYNLYGFVWMVLMITSARGQGNNINTPGNPNVTSTTADTGDQNVTPPESNMLLNTSAAYIKYWAKTVLSIPVQVDFDDNFVNRMESGLSTILNSALQREYLLRKGSSLSLKKKRAVTSGLATVQLTRVERADPQLIASTNVVYYLVEGVITPQYTITAATRTKFLMTLIDSTELAAQLGYPVLIVCDVYDPQPAPTSPRYWIIGAVLGSVVAFMFIAWFIACCYLKCTRIPKRRNTARNVRMHSSAVDVVRDVEMNTMPTSPGLNGVQLAGVVKETADSQTSLAAVTKKKRKSKKAVISEESTCSDDPTPNEAPEHPGEVTFKPPTEVKSEPHHSLAVSQQPVTMAASEPILPKRENANGKVLNNETLQEKVQSNKPTPKRANSVLSKEAPAKRGGVRRRRRTPKKKPGSKTKVKASELSTMFGPIDATYSKTEEAAISDTSKVADDASASMSPEVSQENARKELVDDALDKVVPNAQPIEPIWTYKVLSYVHHVDFNMATQAVCPKLKYIVFRTLNEEYLQRPYIPDPKPQEHSHVPMIPEISSNPKDLSHLYNPYKASNESAKILKGTDGTRDTLPLNSTYTVKSGILPSGEQRFKGRPELDQKPQIFDPRQDLIPEDYTALAFDSRDLGPIRFKEKPSAHHQFYLPPKMFYPTTSHNRFPASMIDDFDEIALNKDDGDSDDDIPDLI